MRDSILVTGATGTIGRDVIKQLRQKRAKVRAAVRDKARARAQFDPSVELAEFDFDKDGTLSAALEGAAKLFVLPPVTPNQSEIVNRLVDAAKEHGVEKIVKLSAIGVDSELSFAIGKSHASSDQQIRESNIAYTLLRPNSFMQNFINYFPPQNGAIYLPWANGKASFIDTRDIAAAAAEALLNDDHVGKTYTLTGPEALGIAEVAQILSEVSGREIKYVDVPESAARDGMLQAGQPPWLVDALMELHAINKQSLWSAVTSDVQKLLGRPATSFKQFASDHKTKFQ